MSQWVYLKKNSQSKGIPVTNSRILLLVLSLSSWKALGNYPILCNSQKTSCEVDTKRLTMGDRVGIFSTGNLLLAIGKVQRLKGKTRVVKITKKFVSMTKESMVPDTTHTAMHSHCVLVTSQSHA